MADTTLYPYTETAAINPISTITVKDKNFGAQHYLAELAAGDTNTFTVANFPAFFTIAGVGATAAKDAIGIICATSASNVEVVSGDGILTTGGGAEDIVVTISSGVVTLTPNATFETKSIYISRIA